MSSPPRKRGKATAQTPPTPPTARAAPNLAKRAASCFMLAGVITCDSKSKGQFVRAGVSAAALRDALATASVLFAAHEAEDGRETDLQTMFRQRLQERYAAKTGSTPPKITWVIV